MDWSKPISGLSLVEMMLFAVSRCTSVLKGSSSARLSQPSSNASRSSLSNRPDPVRPGASAPAPVLLDQSARLRLDQRCGSLSLVGLVSPRGSDSFDKHCLSF